MSLSRFTLLLIVSLLLTVPLFAQSAAPVTGTISGHVYMADGVTPVPNALIHVRTRELQKLIVFDGQADATGAYQIAVPPGSYEVVAEVPGVVNLIWFIGLGEQQMLSVLPGQTLTGIDIFVPSGAGSISGRIVAADSGTPLPNAAVWLYQEEIYPNPLQRSYRSFLLAYTNAEGEFAFSVPDGVYALRAEAAGFLPQYYPSGDQFAAMRLVIVNGNTISLGDFQLPTGGGVITGYVLESDGVTPVPAARVNALNVNDYNLTAYAQTDVSGQYTLSLIPGTYSISAQIGNEASAWTVNYISPDGDSEVEAAAGAIVTGIDIRIPAYGTISGQITLADGAPLTLQPISAFHDLLIPPSELELTTDQAADFQAGISAQIDPLGSAYGFVIMMSKDVPDWWLLGLNVVVPLQADGSYQASLQPGSYAVRSFVGGYGRKYYGDTYGFYAATELNLGEGAALTGVDITLDPAGTVSGMVRDEAGIPVPNVSLKLFIAGDDNYLTCSDVNGHYHFSDIPLNQSLNLQVMGATACGGQPQNYLYQSVPILATDSNPEPTIDVTLHQGAVVTGRVTYATTGAPLTNAFISISEYDYGSWRVFANADVNGDYTLTGVPVGATVHIKTDIDNTSIALTLSAGETRTNVDFALNPTPVSAPHLSQPSGAVTAQAPSFRWEHTSRTSWYYLWVGGQNGHVFDGWFSWDTSCLTYTCAASPLTDLPPGHYTWWVQGWSPVYGYSEWSNPLTFNVPYSAAPTPTAPIGAVSESSATFAWTGLPNVLWYQVWISTPDGSGIERWYNAFDICAANVCAAPDPLDLNAGIYTWWVRGWNYGLYTPWSAATYFALPLPAPTQVAPSGTISAPPLFTWNALPGADWYYLWLSDANGTVMHEWYDAASHCTGLTCTLTLPVTWHEGGYTWWLQAWSPVTGYGAWSPGTGFAYDDPLVPITAPEVVPPTPIPPEEQPPAPDLPPVPDLPPDAPPSDF